MSYQFSWIWCWMRTILTAQGADQFHSQTTQWFHPQKCSPDRFVVLPHERRSTSADQRSPKWRRRRKPQAAKIHELTVVTVTFQQIWRNFTQCEWCKWCTDGCAVVPSLEREQQQSSWGIWHRHVDDPQASFLLHRKIKGPRGMPQIASAKSHWHELFQFHHAFSSCPGLEKTRLLCGLKTTILVCFW